MSLKAIDRLAAEIGVHLVVSGQPVNPCKIPDGMQSQPTQGVQLP